MAKAPRDARNGRSRDRPHGEKFRRDHGAVRVAAPAGPQAAPGVPEPAGAASPAFDWAAAALAAFFVVGAYLDGWAHVHGHVDQSFFTPWHAALYGGFLALAAFVGAAAEHGRRRGLRLRESVPAGYGLSLLGAGAFLAAGVADRDVA